MDENTSQETRVPQLWPFLYDRVIVKWKSTLAGLAAAALVVVPCLMSSGFNNRWVVLTGALALAVTGALTKR